MSAQDIFDHRNADDTLASDNVFAALNGLRMALENNDTAAIQTSLVAVKEASARLNSSLAFYGRVQARIVDATDFAASNATRIQTGIGQKEDADIASTAIEMTQANTQIQAAFQMHAHMPRKTLFDYLG